MRKILIVFTFFPLLAFAQTIQVNGSEAMATLVKSLTNQYSSKVKNPPRFSLSSDGSKIGIEELLSDEIDLCTSTRSLTDAEKNEFAKRNEKVVLVPVCLEALVILVSYSNDLKKLNKQQLSDIFSGKITNFKYVGGKDIPIKVFIRSNASGCYLGFRELIMENEKYSDDAIMLNDNWQIKESMYKYIGAISFLGYGDYANWKSKEAARMIEVSLDGKKFVKATDSIINAGHYPFSRFCYFIYKEKNKTQLKDFIEFVESVGSRDSIVSNGFITIR